MIVEFCNRLFYGVCWQFLMGKMPVISALGSEKILWIKTNVVFIIVTTVTTRIFILYFRIAHKVHRNQSSNINGDKY